MSAASRAAAEAAAKFASLRKVNRVRMGTCPVCETTIYANQKTTWRSVDGTTSRIHKSCDACLDCGQRTTPNHFRDTGSATTLPAGSCPVLFERRNRP